MVLETIEELLNYPYRKKDNYIDGHKTIRGLYKKRKRTDINSNPIQNKEDAENEFDRHLLWKRLWY